MNRAAFLLRLNRAALALDGNRWRLADLAACARDGGIGCILYVSRAWGVFVLPIKSR